MSQITGDILEIYLDEDSQWSPWGNYNFDKPSKAVIAMDDSGNIALLSTVGPHLQMELQESGLSVNEIVPEAPNSGIWIWEGTANYYSHYDAYNGDYDSGANIVTHSWRAPTDGEWAAIKNNECPWDDDDWKLPTKSDVVPLSDQKEFDWNKWAI